MTAATSEPGTEEPGTESPKQAGAAAAFAIAAQVAVLLLAFLIGQVVKPATGGGMEDLAAVAVTFLGGEILVGLGCVIASMVLFRRGRRYTGVGLMGGWIVGLALVIAVPAIL